MSDLVIHLVWMIAAAVALSFAFAPLESLGWWAGWLGPQASSDDARNMMRPTSTPRKKQVALYVVFVSGIGSISGNELLPTESAFLDRLQADLPQAVIVRDVFPYAPSGVPLLTGQRFFTWFWRRVEHWRMSGTHLLPAVLNLRNLFQVLVSADRRYGPLYSFGIARVVLERMRAHGYQPGSRVPVVLLGSSGGAQIAVGAATYLGAALDPPPSVVTFGGVMAADRGLQSVSQVISLYGTRDRVYALGRTMFPGRWAAAVGSNWNKARYDNRLEERRIGRMKHSGRGGYLDASPPTTGGRPNFDVTLDAVGDAIRGVCTHPAPETGRSIISTNTG